MLQELSDEEADNFDHDISNKNIDDDNFDRDSEHSIADEKGKRNTFR